MGLNQKVETQEPSTALPLWDANTASGAGRSEDMDVRYYWLVLGILGCWRLTHLIVAEDGPWQAVARLRRLAGSGFWGSLMDCFHCASLWTSAPLAYFFGASALERGGLWLALSAGAILLEQIRQRLETPPAFYHESEGEEDVLLRKSESPSGLPESERAAPSFPGNGSRASRV